MLNNRESRRHLFVRFEGYIETTVPIYQRVGALANGLDGHEKMALPIEGKAPP